MAIYKLGDISEIRKGKGKFWNEDKNTPGATERAISYGNLFYNKIFNDGEFLVDKKFIDEKNYIKNQSLLLAGSSTDKNGIGKISFFESKHKVLMGSDVIEISINNEIANPRYLYYFFIKNYMILNSRTTGTTVLHINSKDLLNIKIDIPPIEEQQKIIDIIEPVEMIIYNIEKQINSIKNLIENFFKTILDSNWVETKINELANILPMKFIEKRMSSGPIPFFNIKGMQTGKTDQYISYEQYNDVNKVSPLKIHDIIVSTRGSLGISNYIFNEKRYFLGSVAIRLRTKENINSSIFYTALNKVEWSKYSAGSAIPMLTNKDILNAEIIIPKNSNSDFEKIFDDCYYLINNFDDFKENLIELKNKYLELLIK